MPLFLNCLSILFNNIYTMKIKTGKNNHINPSKPFESCKLGREKYANVLTKIVDSYADGFVLAINNEWGTGKTTFVQMWRAHLKNNQFETLYFNAWENDFEDKPLSAILAELKELVTANNNSEEQFKKLASKASVFFKKLLPSIAIGIAKELKIAEFYEEILKSSVEGSLEVLNNDIQDYSKKKNGLIEFKEQLKEYLNSLSNKKPIVFIIDELDRCRPDYAVKVLEQIKHFFSVDGIVFVLSIDKVQLGHAIRGVYGSEQIAADEYLRRFIDVEYSLPEPNTKEFCEYLYEYYDFRSFFETEFRQRNIPKEKSNLLGFASNFFQYNFTPLRVQEKVFSHTRIAINFIKPNQYAFPELIMFLVYIKYKHDDVFNLLLNKKASTYEVINKIGAVLPKEYNGIEDNIFVYVEALLLYLYNNSLSNLKKAPLVLNGTVDRLIINKERFKNKDNADYFSTQINSFGTSEYNMMSIDYLLNKISLIEDIQVM